MRNPPSIIEIQNSIDKYMNIEKKGLLFKPIVESNLSMTELAYYKARYTISNQKNSKGLNTDKNGVSNSMIVQNEKIENPKLEVRSQAFKPNKPQKRDEKKKGKDNNKMML